MRTPAVLVSIASLAVGAATFHAVSAPRPASLETAALVTAHARAAAADESPAWSSTLEWRNIGPDRGGRVSSVAGVVGDRETYYMGATGGGVWKTTDAGSRWFNVTDGFLGTGSVGAVTVAPSDPNVVWAGTGEPDIRGNFSHGDGVYRSTDAGKSWTHAGLEDSRQIGRIAVHPDDPDVALVAALGHVFGSNAERGVFRTTDGGRSWERTLFVNDRTGAVDVAFDPLNPRVAYAGAWQVHRRPWELSSGGEGSGLFRSNDGGATWTELTEGLPEGIKGKIGVSPSAARGGLVYAIVEAEDGGVFRSTDGGDSWTRVNQERDLRQRAWYYSRIAADPVDPDTVYVLNVQLWKSTDGGRTFSVIRVPHVDNHGIWIDPHDAQRVINGNDGGANVSFDGGATWSRQDNQPTAQFYRVTVDEQFPYRVYGAQQDNSTASVSSRARAGGRSEMYAVGGGESGHIAVHPENPDIVYAGSYMGYLTRYDHATGKTRNIQVWPENTMGAGVEQSKHRFQWNFPILLSPHDPNRLYAAGERLFLSTNEGQSWTAISPDLTTNDPTKQRSSGGPITKDNTSVEYFCTIFAVAESPLVEGLIWAGTDDGLVHVTSDGGETWTDVTPPDIGDWSRVNGIEASPHDPDVAYLAVNRYQMNDFAPYVWRTRDRGETWELVVEGIDDEDAFVRGVREDPVREGLLYAGTETGMWVSFDAGDRWESLQLELPVVPVTDLVVKDDDLVIATQGRSFWILDDLTPLRHFEPAIAEQAVALMPVPDTYRQSWDRVRVHYHLAEETDAAVAVAFLDEAGEVVRTFSSATPGEEEEPSETESWFGRGRGSDEAPESGAGMHVFEWDMRHEGPSRVPGLVGWPSAPRSGPLVAPGRYTVRLTVGDDVHETPVEIAPDPRVDTSPEAYRAQEAFLLEVRDLLTETHDTVNSIRSIRGAIDDTLARATRAGMKPAPADDAADSADAQDAVTTMFRLGTSIKERLTEIEETLVQTKSKSAQDPLNFPVKLNDKLVSVLYSSEGDYPVTDQARAVFADLSMRVVDQLERSERVMSSEIARFNRAVADADVPAIPMPSDAADDGQPDEEAVAPNSRD